MKDLPYGRMDFMVERAVRVKRAVDIPPGVSWNLGIPSVAEQVIQDGLVDLVFLGRPALSKPHWPIRAAPELGHFEPFSMVPKDWPWWLSNPCSQAAAESISLPPLPSRTKA